MAFDINEFLQFAEKAIRSTTYRNNAHDEIGKAIKSYIGIEQVKEIYVKGLFSDIQKEELEVFVFINAGLFIFTRKNHQVSIKKIPFSQFKNLNLTLPQFINRPNHILQIHLLDDTIISFNIAEDAPEENGWIEEYAENIDRIWKAISQHS